MNNTTQMHQLPALRRQAGFTLMELLIVIAIIAVLMGGIFTLVPRVRLSAAVNTEMQNLALIQGAAGTFYDNFQEVPSSAAGLASLVPDLQSLKVSDDNLLSRWGVITIGKETDPNATPSAYVVTYKSVPAEACKKLVPNELKNWDYITINGVSAASTSDSSALIALAEQCDGTHPIGFHRKST